MAPSTQPSPPTQMLGMLNGFLTVQALHVAAFLGIADLLASGPQSVDELAAATGAHRSSLQRLLRMLTGPGVFCAEAWPPSRDRSKIEIAAILQVLKQQMEGMAVSFRTG